MNRSHFRFLDPLRVRWAEIDAQQIVFNAHYLMYIDTAVAGYWRALALPYHETMQQLQGDLYVRKATLEYEGSARYDDRLHVGIRCARIGKSSMLFEAAVFKGERRLVFGELVYVFADPATQTSKPVPQALRDVLEGFEAGEPMAEVRVGDWAEMAAAAGQLRHEVFAQEQGVAAELMTDAADPQAVHALVVNRFGMALASGRLLSPEPGVGQIGRMATRAILRGTGLGTQLLRALLDAARRRGDRDVVLNAQATAVDFYRAEGFEPVGPAYEEAGLTHQAMRRAL